MEVTIDNKWKFYIYVFFQIFIALGVLVMICLVGYFVFFNENIAYKQLSQSCDEMFGEGNWTIQDTRIRSNWYSIGQEFTCVKNGTEEYFNELKKDVKKWKK